MPPHPDGATPFRRDRRLRRDRGAQADDTPADDTPADGPAEDPPENTPPVPSSTERGSVRIVERRSHTLGLPPGTLTLPPPGAPVAPARLCVLRYDAGSFEEHQDVDVPTAHALAEASATDVAWIDLDGVADVATVGALGEAFGLHPLVQEDLTHTSQRPKLDVYGDRLVVFLKMVRPFDGDPAEAYCAGRAGHEVEQVALVLGPGYVLTFQEHVGDVFDFIRARIRQGGGIIREQGADYLFYALLDVIVDHYFITLERIGDATERFEDLVFRDPAPAVQEALSRLRREVVVLRRALWPLREVLTGLLREETPGLTARTRLYLRDAYDHVVQAVDLIESLRDVIGGLSDLYLSALSHRMNEVMKVLTVIGTLFIPLTFLAGIYGMNFDVMPELHTRYGYFALLGVMAVLAAGILVYFRRRGWI